MKNVLIVLIAVSALYAQRASQQSYTELWQSPDKHCAKLWQLHPDSLLALAKEGDGVAAYLWVEGQEEYITSLYEKHLTYSEFSIAKNNEFQLLAQCKVYDFPSKIRVYIYALNGHDANFDFESKWAGPHSMFRRSRDYGYLEAAKLQPECKCARIGEQQKCYDEPSSYDADKCLAYATRLVNKQKSLCSSVLKKIEDWSQNGCPAAYYALSGYRSDKEYKEGNQYLDLALNQGYILNFNSRPGSTSLGGKRMPRMEKKFYNYEKMEIERERQLLETKTLPATRAIAKEYLDELKKEAADIPNKLAKIKQNDIYTTLIAQAYAKLQKEKVDKTNELCKSALELAKNIGSKRDEKEIGNWLSEIENLKTNLTQHFDSAEQLAAVKIKEREEKNKLIIKFIENNIIKISVLQDSLGKLDNLTSAQKEQATKKLVQQIRQETNKNIGKQVDLGNFTVKDVLEKEKKNLTPYGEQQKKIMYEQINNQLAADFAFSNRSGGDIANSFMQSAYQAGTELERCKKCWAAPTKYYEIDIDNEAKDFIYTEARNTSSKNNLDDEIGKFGIYDSNDKKYISSLIPEKYLEYSYTYEISITSKSANKVNNLQKGKPVSAKGKITNLEVSGYQVSISVEI
jgi:hypothetical protein